MLSLAAHGGNVLRDEIHNACDRPLGNNEPESNVHRVAGLMALEGLPCGWNGRSQCDNDQREEPIGMTQDQLAKRKWSFMAISFQKQLV
jgi:hypothetical protein